MRPLIADITLSLWRLLPGNPIVVRVVQGGSKRVQHLWARTVYLLVLFFVLLIMQLLYGQSGGSLADLAKSSTRVFEYISVIQLALMCFIAPIFTAGAISQEKDAETFNVLLTTPLSNAQIVLGSLMGRLFFVIALLFAGMPIFCITMVFGGVTGEQIFLSFGIAGCTALLMGALAIAISVFRIGSQGTIFSFYMGIALFISAGLALGLWDKTFVPESIIPGSSEGMSFLAPFHPFLALAVALDHTHTPDFAAVEHYVWPLNYMLAAPHKAYMVLTVVVSLVMIALATCFVRSGIKQGQPSWWSRLLRRRTGTANGERSRRPRRVWSNPVAWREAVTRASAASSNLVRYCFPIGGIVAGVLLLITYGTGQFSTHAEARAWLTGIVLIEFFTVMLAATNTAATAIAREREAGTMELLLSTPLTSRYIIWGKLRGLVSFTVPLLAIPAATVLVAAIYDLIRGTAEPIAYIGPALLLGPLMLVYSALACMIGLYMSLKSKSSVQAVLKSVGILVFVGFGLSMCGFGLVHGTGLAGTFAAPLTFASGIWLMLNPPQAAAGASGAIAGAAQVPLLIGTLVAVLIYGLVVAGIYRSMLANFDMIVRKQSQ